MYYIYLYWTNRIENYFDSWKSIVSIGENFICKIFYNLVIEFFGVVIIVLQADSVLQYATNSCAVETISFLRVISCTNSNSMWFFRRFYWSSACVDALFQWNFTRHFVHLNAIFFGVNDICVLMQITFCSKCLRTLWEWALERS